MFLLLGKCFLSQKQQLFALYSCCRYLLLYIFQCCKPYLEFWLNLDSDLACTGMIMLSILNNCPSGGGGGADHTVKL